MLLSEDRDRAQKRTQLASTAKLSENIFPSSGHQLKYAGWIFLVGTVSNALRFIGDLAGWLVGLAAATMVMWRFIGGFIQPILTIVTIFSYIN